MFPYRIKTREVDKELGFRSGSYVMGEMPGEGVQESSPRFLGEGAVPTPQD